MARPMTAVRAVGYTSSESKYWTTRSCGRLHSLQWTLHHSVPAILLKNSLHLFYIHIHQILYEYSWTCIEQHHTKQSSCIKHLVIKIPTLFPLNHFNFNLYLLVTSIRQSQSPLSESQQPVCIIFHPFWAVT